MKWEKNIFIDTCLPFGLRSAPKFLLTYSHTESIHYLDDFLMMDPPRSTVCQKNLIYLSTLAKSLATEKVEGPSTCLTFLGVLDSAKSEIRLPEEKLLCICQELSTWLRKK